MIAVTPELRGSIGCFENINVCVGGIRTIFGAMHRNYIYMNKHIHSYTYRYKSPYSSMIYPMINPIYG